MHGKDKPQNQQSMQDCFKMGKFTKLTFYFNPQSMQVSREAWERQITNQQEMNV